MTKQERIKLKRPAEFRAGDIISIGDWKSNDSSTVEFMDLRLLNVLMILSIELTAKQGMRWCCGVPLNGGRALETSAMRATRKAEGRSNLWYRLADNLFYPSLMS